MIETNPGEVERQSRMYITPEVAAMLRVHPNTVDSERKAGRLRCIRIGRRVLFTEGQIMEYIKQLEEGGKISDS